MHDPVILNTLYWRPIDYVIILSDIMIQFMMNIFLIDTETVLRQSFTIIKVEEGYEGKKKYWLSNLVTIITIVNNWSIQASQCSSRYFLRRNSILWIGRKRHQQIQVYDYWIRSHRGQSVLISKRGIFKRSDLYNILSKMNVVK